MGEGQARNARKGDVHMAGERAANSYAATLIVMVIIANKTAEISNRHLPGCGGAERAGLEGDDGWEWASTDGAMFRDSVSR